jgi:3-oxoacyl-[acyl-carrier protein] reductase
MARTAIVTGACGSGMGRSTALCLAREGANVVLNYGTYRRGVERRGLGEEIAAAVARLGGRAIVYEADTKEERQVAAMVQAAQAEFGSVDIVVNNAGGPFRVADFTETSLEDWKDVLAAEVDAPYLLMQQTLPAMRRRGWGRVIHIGAEDALHVPNGSAADYFLGKAARGWMTVAFAPRDEAHGITMNCIEPHITPHVSFDDAVDLAAGVVGDREVAVHDPGSGREVWRGPWPDRPGPTSHDVAETIAFLCSDRARFISGTLVRLPGFPGV